MGYDIQAEREEKERCSGSNPLIKQFLSIDRFQNNNG
jgi:hypothetical protein